MLIELRNLVSENGRVDELYGGYEITVNETRVFPWAGVFEMLLNKSHEIWVTRTEDKIVIKTKPPRE